MIVGQWLMGQPLLSPPPPALQLYPPTPVARQGFEVSRASVSPRPCPTGSQALLCDNRDFTCFCLRALNRPLGPGRWNRDSQRQCASGVWQDKAERCCAQTCQPRRRLPSPLSSPSPQPPPGPAGRWPGRAPHELRVSAAKQAGGAGGMRPEPQSEGWGAQLGAWKGGLG